jgi:hypothetical protein
MRWHSRSLVFAAGIVALVALGAAWAPGLNGRPRFSPGSPLVRATDDRVAFVGVVDTRRSPSLGDLVGFVEIVMAVAAARLWCVSRRSRGPAGPSDRHRRWRARLVGAPPTFA